MEISFHSWNGTPWIVGGDFNADVNDKQLTSFMEGWQGACVVAGKHDRGSVCIDSVWHSPLVTGSYGCAMDFSDSDHQLLQASFDVALLEGPRQYVFHPHAQTSDRFRDDIALLFDANVGDDDKTSIVDWNARVAKVVELMPEKWKQLVEDADVDALALDLSTRMEKALMDAGVLKPGGLSRGSLPAVVTGGARMGPMQPMLERQWRRLLRRAKELHFCSSNGKVFSKEHVRNIKIYAFGYIQHTGIAFTGRLALMAMTNTCNHSRNR